MIKNRSELLSHGFIKGREKALDIAEQALQHVDPLAAVKRHVTLAGNMLRVNEDIFNLNKVNKIYAIGAGKATYPLAVALEEILGDRINDGFIAIKKGQKNPFCDMLGTLSRIRVAESAHPVPDATSLAAGKEIWRLTEKAGQGDMVFCLMSGGVSAQSVILLRDYLSMTRSLSTSC